MTIREVTLVERENFPYGAIGLVEVTYRDGSTAIGTASVVGRNDVLTAAHVIYDPDRGGWAESLDFYFGADYNSRLGYFEDYGYRLTSGFRWEAKAGIQGTFSDADNSTVLSSESQHDVALIGLSVEIGAQTGWLGLDAGRDFSQTLNMAGYPSGSTGLMTERVSVTPSSRWGIYEGVSKMGPGSSGGPLFTDDDYVIGVMSGGIPGGYAVWADLGFSWSWMRPFIDENDSLLGSGLTQRDPTYKLTAHSPIINEGDTARFTLTTTNVEALTSLTYRITGVQAADIEFGRLSGTVMVGLDGNATVSVVTRRDLLTEGDEILTLSIETSSASTLIKDTSQAGQEFQRTKVFMSNQAFTAVDPNLQLFGSEGANDRVILQRTAIGASLDQKIEQVSLSGVSSDYRFKQAGNTLQVYLEDASTLLFSKPLQSDSDGSQLLFSNGVFDAQLSLVGVMTIGGETVSATTVGTVLLA